MLTDPHERAEAAVEALLAGNDSGYRHLKSQMREQFGKSTQSFLTQEFLKRLVLGHRQKEGKQLNQLFALLVDHDPDAGELLAIYCASEALKVGDLIERCKLMKFATRHAGLRLTSEAFRRYRVEVQWPEYVLCKMLTAAPGWPH